MLYALKYLRQKGYGNGTATIPRITNIISLPIIHSYAWQIYDIELQFGIIDS